MLYFAAFVALGLSAGAFGPAIALVADSTSTALTAISIVFIAHGLGRACGSLLGGWLLERMNSHRLIAAAIGVCAAMCLALPIIPGLFGLIAVATVLGVAVNIVDVACNASIIQVHGARVGPFMNALHATFGIGGAIAPLLIGRSLAWTNGIGLAYTLVAISMLPVTVLLAFTPSPRLKLRAAPDSGTVMPIVLTGLIAALFFSMVGVEVLALQMTYQFGLSLGMDRTLSAPALASLLWWLYTAGRLLAIPLSLRIAPRTLVMIDFFGIFAASALLTVIVANKPAPNNTLLWVAVAAIGLFVASAFPSTVSWISNAFAPNSKRLGLFFAASNVGAMLTAWAFGQIVEANGPLTFPAMSLAIATLTLVVAALLWTRTRRNPISAT
jgi:MFS family permease